MKKICFLFILTFFFMEENFSQNFKQQQLKSERVKIAYKEKENFLRKKLDSVGIKGNFEIFLLACKKEMILEVWAKKRNTKQFSFLISYPFCAFSGELGPKRQEGDLQIPEGFYHIDVYNPWSTYYLAMRVNYPNVSDLILTTNKQHPGGDICIHGDCCTIGCIPLTDDKIKELYLLCVEAKSAGQGNIPVYIFPSRLDDKNFESLKKEFSDNSELILFWENLKEGYDFFEKNKTLPTFSVDKKGKYIFR